MAKKINIAKPPQLVGIPRVDFITPDFDTLIWNKGYDILLEESMPCPCSMKVNSPQSACRNCGGTGWLYTKQTKAKAVIQSINKSTQYKDWSETLMGTVNVTIESRFQLSFRDRLTVLDSESIGVEVQIVRQYENKTFIYTIYPIDEIIAIYKYNGNEVPLDKVSNYKFDKNVVYFENSEVNVEDSISIRYKHKVMYSVIDINHDIRNTYRLNEKSRENQIRMPVNAVARKLHYISDAPSVVGPTILENE